MKRLFLIACMGLVSADFLTAQSPDDPNEGSKVEWDEANSIWRIKWWGRAGRTYFIQHSPDLLRPWQWLPTVEVGDDSIKQGGFNTSGGRAFLRLRYSDIPTTDPEGADFDRDGLSNLAEVQAGASPFDLDSDQDGLPDGFEAFLGTNPSLSDSNNNGMPDGEELQKGGDPATPGPPPTGPAGTQGDPPPADPPQVPPGSLPHSGYDILLETSTFSLPKYGFETFEPSNPPRRYLKKLDQDYHSYTSAAPDHPYQSVSAEYVVDPLTGGVDITSSVPDFFPDMSCSPPSTTVTTPLSLHTSQDVADENGFRDSGNFSYLRKENKTHDVVLLAKANLPPFAGEFETGTPFAFRNMHKNELQFDYQKVQFKFQWQYGVAEAQRHAVSYLVVFQPEDDPQTPQYEPVVNAEFIDLITWNGQSAESEVFTIDPDQRKSGVDGSYFLRTVEIVPDAGMAGVVGDMAPSNRGNSGEKHFVTPKTTAEISAPYAIFTVSGMTSAEFQQFFEWGPGGESVAGEPHKRRVSRNAADKVTISLKLKQTNQEAAKLNAWVVWASAVLVQVPTPLFYTSVNVGLVDGTFGNRATYIASDHPEQTLVFEFTIYPIGMCDLTSDIPDFRGFPTVLPPGESSPLEPSKSLSSGADAKWDDSRAIQITITNPNVPRGKYPISSLLVGNPDILAGQPANGAVLEFPSSDVIGTDDSSGTSVGGHPYEVSLPSTPNRLKHVIGKMRSDDRPSSSISDYLTENATYEEANAFREFLRLNIGTRWYRVSNFMHWEFRLRTTKEYSNMLDDGSFSGSSL